jgi:hypothetical protein
MKRYLECDNMMDQGAIFSEHTTLPSLFRSKAVHTQELLPLVLHCHSDITKKTGLLQAELQWHINSV